MGLFAHYANICLRYIQMIKITDIIDMAIIAYIIYRLLLLTKKSRSGQVLGRALSWYYWPWPWLIIAAFVCALLHLCGGPWNRLPGIDCGVPAGDSPFSWNRWAVKGSVNCWPLRTKTTEAGTGYSTDRGCLRLHVQGPDRRPGGL